MPSLHDFDFVAAAASDGSEPAALGGVQRFLERFGYMRPQTVGAFAANTLDDGTGQGLRLYQAFHGLPVTGVADDATVAEMSKPRCGFPDFPDVADFEVDGRKWDRTALSYRIINSTPDLSDAEVRAAMRAAAAQTTLADFLRRAEEHDVPASRINTLDDLPTDAQVVHNATFVERAHPAAGMLREARPAPTFSATPAEVSAPAPLFGEHSDQIVRELGLDPATLRAAGVVH